MLGNTDRRVGLFQLCRNIHAYDNKGRKYIQTKIVSVIVIVLEGILKFFSNIVAFAK